MELLWLASHKTHRTTRVTPQKEGHLPPSKRSRGSPEQGMRLHGVAPACVITAALLFLLLRLRCWRGLRAVPAGQQEVVNASKWWAAAMLCGAG
eukprot:1159972-Pelagomonas_calceolata.AAC.11